MKKKAFLLFVLFMFIYNAGWPQDAQLSLPDVSVCDSSSVTINIDAVDLFDVGAMTLEIAFDTAVLSFDTIINIHPNFAGTIFNFQIVPQPKIVIIYSNFFGTNLASGTLLNIIFYYKNGGTNVSFLPACELVTPQFQTIEVDYFDGVVQNEVIIEQQPEDQNVHQPDPAFFSVETQAPLDYQWQISYNGGASFTNLSNSALFQGVNTDELTLNYTNPFVNGTIFRCEISSENCMKYSQNATLTVLPPLVNHDIMLNAGWNSLSTFVDPVNKDLDTLFNPIQNQLVILVEGEHIYFPEGNLNTIGPFNPESGYAIKVNESATLTISGTRQTNNTIGLSAGWNYLPVLAECEIAAEELFIDITPSLEMVKEIAGTKCYWPAKNINTLEYLQPGNAYLIKLNTASEITFPACN